MSPLDPVWEELGKIDYLLDQLARSVERGEVERRVYDRMSPRFLARRADLADVLRQRQARVVPVPLSPGAPTMPTDARLVRVERAPVTPGDRVPESTQSTPAQLSEPVGEPQWWAQPATAEGRQIPPRYAAPRSAVSAGTWMTFAGGFLVIVAVAIFTIYAWASMPALAKLAVLVAVTAMFYVGGEVVRTRMELPAAGIALTGVGSAMLLFDGWAVINNFGMTGALPWAVLLLLCSLAYWATELRIAGGWFGAIGAAAQVGWWWLLGSALHLPMMWQIAGIAVVALLWAFASRNVPSDGPLAALGTVLRGGSVLLATVMPVAMLAQTFLDRGVDDVGLVAAAFVVAVAATVVIELHAPDLRRYSAVLHVPVVAALLTTGDPGVAAGLSAAFALLYGAYAVLRGAVGYASLSLAAVALAVWVFGQRFAWESTMTTGVGAGLFAAAAVGGFLLWRRPAGNTQASSDSPATLAGLAWHTLGILGLAVTTVIGVPAAAGGVPLSSVAVTAAHVLLALWVLALWTLTVAVTRREEAGWVLFGWSFYAMAAVVAWGWPDMHSAWYAAALILLAVAWRQVEPVSDQLLGVERAMLTTVSRTLMLAIPIGGAIASSVFFSLSDVPMAALLALAAIAWAADALRSGDSWAFAPAAAFGVAAAFVGGWHADSATMAAVWAAAAGAVFALAGAFGSRRMDGWGAFLAAGGVLPATVALVAGFGNVGHLAVALAFVTVAWALSTIAADMPVLFGVAGVFSSFTLLATLWWRDPAPIVSYLAYSVLAVALFAPVVLSLGNQGGMLRRAARPLATAALFTMGQFALLGFIQMSVGQPDIGTRALQIGQPALAYGLIASGAMAVLWSALEDFEMGGYLGYASMLFGILTFMDLTHVKQTEFYLLAIAAYAIGMGVLYSRKGVGRRVPASSNGVAFTAAVIAPFLLSLGAYKPMVALEHGLWTLFLAIAAIVGGLMSRTKLYFLGGITIASLEALYMSRSVLMALPAWVWIGLGGFFLIFGGVRFARRELLGKGPSRQSDGFVDWR
jgi:hypothetical protein